MQQMILLQLNCLQTMSLVNQSMPDAGQVRAVLTQALRVWERSSKLTFREVYSDQADIQVLFARRDHGDGYKFDGPGQILAHAFYPGIGRGGDAHFDDDENWQFTSSDTDEGTNFMGVAVHEFGHSLGLGHSSDQKAIMYPWYHGYEKDLSLPDDDRTAIQELYGSREKTWGPFKPPTRPKATTTTTTTTTTTMRPLVFYPDRRYPEYRPDNNPAQRYPSYQPNDPRHPSYYDPNDPRRQHHQHNPNYPHHHNPNHRHPEARTTTSTSSTTSTSTTTTTYRPYTDSPPRPTVRPTAKKWNNRRYNTHMTPKPRKLKPDSCLTTYDAISMIRRELFIFRGQFLWRIGDRGLYPGYPTETRRLWSALPENFTKIDAVYENRDKKIVFFIGRYYYVFDSITLERGYPQPLSTLGLPSSLKNIDAAFIWGYNNRTYLFSGTLYWRFDEDIGRVELDYPRDMAIWSGIGYNIDAAFQYSNGKTYFFKDLGYWEFNDNRMMVVHMRPKLSARKWMNCPRRVNEVDEEQTWTSPLKSERNETLNDLLPNGTQRVSPLQFSTIVIVLALLALRR